jgi:lipoprotein-anchoring transpeptidase ErfK/SrfK
MIREGVHRTPVAGRLWQIAVLTAAGAIGTAARAEAALYYWSDSDSGYYRPGPIVPQRRQMLRRHQAKKTEASEKQSAKPEGPLIIAISIDKQNLKIYDANGFFAEAPVSTGMKGHPTPTGVFSVIQKHKLHHSNIYSGAPMPYMQRITWSGVAIHAGVLPGYPASHGCIRMPMAFAIKMWNWTRMGARVLVTPGEMKPSSFSHPLLVTQKVAPQPTVAEPQTDTPAATKSDKASDAGTPIKPAMTQARLELRSTVGLADGARQAMGAPASTSSPEQTHTADASGHMPATRSPVTMSDAAPSGGNASPREEPRTETAPPITEDAHSVKVADTLKPDSKPETAKSEVAESQAAPVTAKPGETASSDEKPLETEVLESATALEPAETGTTGEAENKPDETVVAAHPSADAVRSEVSATESATAEEKAGEKNPEAKADEAKAAAPKPEAPGSGEKSSDKPDGSVKAVMDIGAGVPDVKKDQTRLPDTSKPAPATATAPKRAGQISVFISRKDSKLYVRQNFAPLFDAPVTIAPSDRPLGTHVFTAQIDKDDANIVHWSAVSLPVPVRYVERRDEDGRASRRRKAAGAATEVKALPVPDSPTEALDRLTIPADAMARITGALSTGGSIIVSDQGIGAGETGEGTDFIVSLR